MSLPTGTITFLFSDIAGSTPMWEKMPHAMGQALQKHDAILRQAIESHEGHVFKTVGDAFHAAFATPENALNAAVAAQIAISTMDWGEIGQLLVRMAIHTGTADERDGDYFGASVNRVARVLALGNPGQILLSRTAADLLLASSAKDVSFLDLGDFELRGMTRSERIYQVVHPNLKSDFSPLRPSSITPTNLPPQLSSFIGRQAELSEVLSALRKSRLVTLTGSGGSGKTRLAIESASECMSSFPEGAWIAEFAPVAEGQSVTRTIASVLNISELPGQREIDRVCDELRHQKLLLIMDNCEHVLDASAAAAESILKAAPDVHILATSREAIGIPGEIVLRIPSMGLPGTSEDCSPADLDRFDGTKLFLERALAVDQSFNASEDNCATIVQICRRLDGIPLAIELAASRLRGMAIGQLAERLDDRFRILTGGSRTAVSRQRTLRALIDWSYDLLSEKEAALLRCVSVFSGGWTIEAAEYVATSDLIDAAEVLDLLSSLVEKSLVLCERHKDGRGRYRLLETIRQYAADKLADSGEAEATRTRHLRFFEALMDRREKVFSVPAPSHGEKSGTTVQLAPTINQGPATETPAHREILSAVDADWENIRATIEWALATEPATGLRLAAGLGGYYERRLHIVEGAEMLDHALRVSSHLGDTPERFMATFCAARLALRRADMDGTRTLAEEARRTATVLGMEAGQAQATAMLGNFYMNDGNFVEARKAFHEIRGAGVRLDIPELRARGSYGLMLLSRLEGNVTNFLELADDATREFEVAGMPLWITWTESYRGWYAEDAGQLADAARIYNNVMEQMLDGQFSLGGIWHWECMARVCVLAGMYDVATQLLTSAEIYRRKSGWPMQPTEVKRNEVARQRAESALGDAYEASVAAGRLLSFDQTCQMTTQAAQDIGINFADKRS